MQNQIETPAHLKPLLAQLPQQSRDLIGQRWLLARGLDWHRFEEPDQERAAQAEAALAAFDKATPLKALRDALADVRERLAAIQKDEDEYDVLREEAQCLKEAVSGLPEAITSREAAAKAQADAKARADQATQQAARIQAQQRQAAQRAQQRQR